MKRLRKRITVLSFILCIALQIGILNPLTVQAAEPLTYTYNYTGGVEELVIEKTGIYQLEVWGAQGSNSSPYIGGYGGYSKGNIILKKGQALYVCVGGQGTSVGYYAGGTSGIAGGAGFNGGGNGAGYVYDGYAASGSGGGGATHIAIGTNRGILRNYASYKSEILIVAGGGGGAFNSGGGAQNGGAGGGTTGGGSYPGTQSGAGYTNTVDGTIMPGGFGYGASQTGGRDSDNDLRGGSGAGGGWYGGGVAGDKSVASGGSGYIGGVPNFTWGNASYTASMQNGVQSGNGKAVITLVKPLVEVSVPETEMDVIETQNIYIPAEVTCITDYKWEISTDDGSTWMEVFNGYLGHTITNNFTTEDGADSGTSTLTCPTTIGSQSVKYKISIENSIESITDELIISVNIIKKTATVVTPSHASNVEAGDTLSIDDITVSATYNTGETIDVSGDENLCFVVSGTDTEEIIPKTVGSNDYTVKYTYNGSSCNGTLTVNVVDTTAPVITAEEYSTSYTNQPFDITYSATDNSDGALTYAFSTRDDLTAGDITSANTTSTVSDNGTYYIYAIDPSGNIGKKLIFITNFDYEAPSATLGLSYAGSFPDASNKIWSSEATVTVTATDNVKLHDTAYKFDDGEWISNNSKQYDRNGNFKVIVRDSVGNEREISFTIDCIDEYNPSITSIKQQYYEGSVLKEAEVTAQTPLTRYKSLVVTASDAESGMDPKGYRISMDNTNWSEWQASNILANLYLNGDYYVQVKDNCNNITTQKITLNGFTEEFDVKYIDVDTKGNVLGTITSALPIGTGFSGAELGINANTGAYYPGYYYIGCNTATVQAFVENVVHRYFELQQYEIEYHDANGALYHTEVVNYGEKATYATTPHKESVVTPETTTQYIFNAWVNEDGNNVSLDNIRSDLKLYPKYEEKRSYNMYTVNFYADNVLLESTEVGYGNRVDTPKRPTKKATETTYQKTQYTFKKWVDINGNPLVFDSITKNINAYAEFEETTKDKYYMVTFKADNNVYASVVVKAGEDVTEPPKPIIPGYKVTGYDRSFENILQDTEINAILEEDDSYIASGIITEDTNINGANGSNNSLINDGSDVEILTPDYSNGDADENANLDVETNNKFLDINAFGIDGITMETITKTLSENKGIQNSVKTGVLVSTAAVTYGLASAFTTLLTGTSLTQLFIFAYALLRKKLRYVKGAWLTSEEGMKYVDKYGRAVEMRKDKTTGHIVFTRKGKVLSAVVVDEVIEDLNHNKIRYDAFETIINRSEVYTVFNKDVQIETQNIASLNGKNGKAKGYNLTKSIRALFDNAGDYAVRINNAGKQAMFEIKYAFSEDLS